MKHFFLLLSFVFISSMALGQTVRPDQQPSKSPVKTDALYTQESGTLQKVRLDSLAEWLKRTFIRDTSLTNEIQTIDALTLSGTNLNVSLENDGVANQTVDLSPLRDGTGTDDQTATEVPVSAITNLTATNVQAALAEHQSDIDGLAAGGADGTPTAGTHDTANDEIDVTVASPGSNFSISIPTLLEFEDTTSTLATKHYVDSNDNTGTDDQTIDALTLTGTTLNISLENDGVANQTVDLSPLQDGTGTDDQTATEVPVSAITNLTATNVQAALAEHQSDIDGLAAGGADGTPTAGTHDTANDEIDVTVASPGSNFSISIPTLLEFEDTTSTLATKHYVDNNDNTGTDDQTIDALTLTGTTLNISLENDGVANQTVDLSPLQDGTGTDDQTATEVPVSAITNLTATNVQAALAEHQSDIDGLAAGGADGTPTAGTHDTANDEIDVTVASPGSNFSISIPTLLEFEDTTSTLATKHYVDSNDNTGTDDQTIDALTLTGTNLNISLENDGVANQTVDLSPLQDGNGFLNSSNQIIAQTRSQTGLVTLNGGSNDWTMTGYDDLRFNSNQSFFGNYVAAATGVMNIGSISNSSFVFRIHDVAGNPIGDLGNDSQRFWIGGRNFSNSQTWKVWNNNSVSQLISNSTPWQVWTFGANSMQMDTFGIALQGHTTNISLGTNSTLLGLSGTTTTPAIKVPATLSIDNANNSFLLATNATSNGTMDVVNLTNVRGIYTTIANMKSSATDGVVYVEETESYYKILSGSKTDDDLYEYDIDAAGKYATLLNPDKIKLKTAKAGNDQARLELIATTVKEGTTIIIPDDANFTSQVTFSRKRDLHIKGDTIAVGAHNFILLDTCTNIIVEGFRVGKATADANYIVFGRMSENITVRNCNATKTAIANFSNCNIVKVEDCKGQTGSSDGMIISNCHQIIIESTIFDNYTNDGIKMQNKCSQFDINNCRFVSNGDDFFDPFNGGHTGQIRNCYIKDNNAEIKNISGSNNYKPAQNNIKFYNCEFDNSKLTMQTNYTPLLLKSATFTGDGTTTSFTVTHNLGYPYQYFMAFGYDGSTSLGTVTTATNSNNAFNATFATAPANGVTFEVLYYYLSNSTDYDIEVIPSGTTTYNMTTPTALDVDNIDQLEIQLRDTTSSRGIETPSYTATVSGTTVTFTFSSATTEAYTAFVRELSGGLTGLVVEDCDIYLPQGGVFLTTQGATSFEISNCDFYWEGTSAQSLVDVDCPFQGAKLENNRVHGNRTALRFLNVKSVNAQADGITPKGSHLLVKDNHIHELTRTYNTNKTYFGGNISFIGNTTYNMVESTQLNGNSIPATSSNFGDIRFERNKNVLSGGTVELGNQVPFYEWTTSGRPDGSVYQLGKNTTTNEVDFYDGTAWTSLSSGGGGSSVYGSEFQKSTASTYSTNASNSTWNTYMTFTTSTLPAGTYRIRVSAIVSTNTDDKLIDLGASVNGTDLTTAQTGKTTMRFARSLSGHRGTPQHDYYYVNGSSQTLEIDLDFKSGSTSNTALVYYGVIEVIRVE